MPRNFVVIAVQIILSLYVICYVISTCTRISKLNEKRFMKIQGKQIIFESLS